MRTYISPIGYDTRRVTRPVISTGLSSGDTIRLLRPAAETDEERAAQAIADVEQLLQEIEPNSECVIERISMDSFEETVRDCCTVVGKVPDERETIVSLGGGARDILLPLTISSLVYAHRLDRTLFFSDLDSQVREWSLPTLTAQVPERTFETFETLVGAADWRSLSDVATETNQSKSTVIRHVQALEDVGVVESKTVEKTKHVRVSFSGELFWLPRR